MKVKAIVRDMKKGGHFIDLAPTKEVNSYLKTMNI